MYMYLALIQAEFDQNSYIYTEAFCSCLETQG